MREKNIFYIYGCFSVSRYMKEGRKPHWIWIELNLKFKIEFLDTHVCINNPHWQRSGIIIFLSKCYMVISDKLVGSFLDVLFFLLPVILSELCDKPRRKDIVTAKSTKKNLCEGHHFFDYTPSFLSNFLLLSSSPPSPSRSDVLA